MKTKISVDKDIDIPLYMQLYNQICEQVEKGNLAHGDKLPTERELALETGISRGTVKKAFEELERNNVIFSIQGSGSFVQDISVEVEISRKDKAITAIDEVVDKLQALGFMEQEIRIFIDLRLRQRFDQVKKIKVAALDCNPEALSIYYKQLSYLPNIDINTFLLDEAFKSKNTEELLSGFDCILTTTTHVDEVTELLPSLKSKIIKCAVSPNSRTIVALAQINKEEKVGVLCESERFAAIIFRFLSNLGFARQDIQFIQDVNQYDFNEKLDRCDVLITAPNFLINKGREMMKLINAFRAGGGDIVNFEYQIDTGSMLYVEERILNIKKQDLAI